VIGDETQSNDPSRRRYLPAIPERRVRRERCGKSRLDVNRGLVRNTNARSPAARQDE
jgi:hypothetical protein